MRCKLLGTRTFSDFGKVAESRFGSVRSEVQILSPRLLSEMKPFGENVEGLSHCGDESYVVEPQVQTDDFEDTTLGGEICRKPFLTQLLREFKRQDGDVGFVLTVSAARFRCQP